MEGGWVDRSNFECLREKEIVKCVRKYVRMFIYILLSRAMSMAGKETVTHLTFRGKSERMKSL